MVLWDQRGTLDSDRLRPVTVGLQRASHSALEKQY
jgi:hypothetical protein